MWHGLLFVIALSLFACTGKPRQRAPTVYNKEHKQDASSAGDQVVAQGERFYHVLQHDAHGYQPQVLRLSAQGVPMLMLVSKAYSADGIFAAATPQAFSTTPQAIGTETNLLLAFAVGGESYCTATPLTEVLRWPRGVNPAVLKQALLQAKTPPLDVSTHEGTLEQQEGGLRLCTAG